MTGPLFPESVLTTAYFPPVEYFFVLANSGRVRIEQHEAYQKQSWRNRCRILATAGPEDLSIPVVKEERLSRPIRDIRIDYGEPWLQHHVRAFEAAYRHSAFYDYYADDLLPILQRKPAFLFDLNQSLLEKLLEMLNLHVPIELTDRFVNDYAAGSLGAAEPFRGQRESSASKEPAAASGLRTPAASLRDFRDRIQPKYKGKSLLAEYGCEQAYYQVFINRNPGDSFIPNLSILDLLCAEGPDAGSFLRI